jgi:hypothetical protein
MNLIGLYFNHCLQLLIALIHDANLKPSLGESRGPSVERGRENNVESQNRQGCSLHLCRLRTDRLVPASNY